jgi:uridine kinase
MLERYDIHKMKTSSKLEIVKQINNNQAKLIAIHGAMFSGKSTLAAFLAKELRGCLIHLDDFVKPNPKGSYPNFLNKKELADALNL